MEELLHTPKSQRPIDMHALRATRSVLAYTDTGRSSRPLASVNHPTLNA